VRVTPIADRVDASQRFADQVLVKQPVRIIGTPEAAVEAWQGDPATGGYGQSGRPPPAWIEEPSGKLVVDASQVPMPLRSSDILMGPVRPLEAAPAGGGETMGTEPPVSAGEEAEVEGGQEADFGPERGPGGEPAVMQRPIADAEKVHLLFWQRMRLFEEGHLDDPPSFTIARDIYDANYRLAGGREEPTPPGWLDQHGRLFVDASRVDIHSRPALPSSRGGRE
jgi:hypothetical protein